MHLFRTFQLSLLLIIAANTAAAEPKKTKNRSNPSTNEGMADFKSCVEFKLKDENDIAKAFAACPFTPEGAGAAGKGGIVGGVPTSELIVFAIKHQLPLVRACWEKELGRKPNQSVKATMSFKVDAKGKVEDLKVTDLLAESSVFKTCLHEAWLKFAFPTEVQGKIINYPLNFSDV